MVPNGWTQKFLEDIAEFSQGIQVNPDKQFTEYSEGMVRFLRITDFVDQDETPRFIQNPSNRFIVNNTDLSMVRYGSAGAGDLVRGLSGAIANNLFRVIPNELEVTKDYLWVYLSQSKIKHFLFGNSTSSTMPAVSFKLVGKVLVDLPPLPEQQKIAKILSTWDKAIGTTERLIENSSQQKKALMQQLLTGKKRLLDDEGKRFAGEWEEVKLSKWLVEYKEKSTVQDQYDVYTSSRNGLVLQSVYFANSRIAGRDNIGFHVIPPNHITYRSRSDDGFFTFNLFSNDKNGLISNYYPVFSTKGSNEFFIALFEQYRATFGRYSVGTSQKVLSLNALKDILFKIPSIPEQRKIATVLTNTDKEIELLEQQLADLQQEKKALMQVLLTGKKRVLVDGEVA